MSSWVDNQRQEAFSLWRRYLAMGLHFRDGSGFDYGLYGGATNATFQAFRRRAPEEQAAFIRLKNRLADISQEEFLFANFRFERAQHYSKLLDSESMRVYEGWKEKFGDTKTFEISVKEILISHVTPGRFHNMTEVVLSLVDQNYTKLYEPIAWILQRNPEILTNVRIGVESNELQKIHLRRAIKCQQLYSYLCII